MMKKLVGLLVSVSLMATGVVFAFAATQDVTKKVELRNLVEQRKVLHDKIAKSIDEQKAIKQELKKQIVKVEKTTPDKESLKAKNKLIREKIKAIREVNTELNTSRKTLLEQLKTLTLRAKDLRTEYREAKSAKDTAKMDATVEKMIVNQNEILTNVRQRADIRAQMTVNMK